MLTVELPWPPLSLSPNKRKHWGEISRAKKKYRENCKILSLGLGKGWKKGVRLDCHIYFYPPDKHKRDDDNMIAAFKAGRDGVADAMGVDDSLFRCTYHICDPVKGGKIIFSIS